MKNNKFILSPITKILEDAVQATSGISDGIETHPLCEYLMQTIFLKMTGFQEQKFKCVCWEMANLDYDYRYELLKGGIQGECSDYNTKNCIINQMLLIILKDEANFEMTRIRKEKMLLEATSSIKVIFQNSNLLVMNEKQFKLYENNKKMEAGDFMIKNQKKYQLFEDKIKKEYTEKLYRFRNRCAHNLLSYQQNLPVLEKLLEDETGNNYFTWFKMLILIDKVVMTLFQEIAELKAEFV